MLIMLWSKTPKTNKINPKLNICVVKTDKDGNKSWLYGQNQVTNDGDIYYATRAGVNPTSQVLPDPNFFDAACVLQNPSSANTIAKTDTYGSVTNPIVSSGAVRGLTSGYPKTADADSDNTGASADAISYRFDWATNQINTASGNPITGGAIYDVGQTSPVSGTKILTHWNFTSPATFHKTSTDTLKLFVNHTFNGV